MPAIIFFKDTQNRLIRVNRALAETVGMTRGEMEGRTLFELFPDLAEDYWRDDLEVIASGQPKKNIIEPLETPSGTRWVQTDKIPHRDKTGQAIGIIGLSSDITERKQAEEQLRESRQRLRNLATRLHAVREEERTNVARELHDELGQALTGLLMAARIRYAVGQHLEP